MLRPAVEELRARIAGSVITSVDPGFDDARKVWNADIDRRPAAVVQCANADDVVAAVGYARANGLEIAVRGGAHSLPGHSMCDDGVVVDLRRMNRVLVDPGTRRARVQGGALLADLDGAAQAHGLAIPAGIVGHTGVGGLTLGGGMGWLSRRGGLSIDHLVGADVVTADGAILHACDQENADLFWALRGGGGNFGVVTEFEFALMEVEPTVQFGLFFWPAEQSGEALAFARDLIPDLDLSLNAMVASAFTAPPAPFVPVECQNTTGCALMLAAFDDPAGHQAITDRIRGERPLFEFVTTMPYVALQQLMDEPNGWGSYGYDKGAYVADLTDGVIDALTNVGLQKNSPLSVALLYRLDGAYSDVAEDATAFSGGRSPRYFATMIALCPTADLLPAERAWVRSLFEALEPSMLGDGTYVNVLCEDDEKRLAASYASKYARLQTIKARYDPGNVFHHNANIKPAIT